MVPVVVSAGLAVGVFCGLLFGLGTGKRTATAGPERVSNNAKRAEELTPESMANPNVKLPDKNAPKVASTAGSAAGAAGSNAGSAATGSGASAGSAEPAIKPTKLIVEIKPEAVAQTAKVFVDGNPITGTTADIAFDPGTTKKKVKVVVKTPGYKDVEQEIEVEGESTTLKLDLIKGRPGPTAVTGGTGDGAAGAGTPPTGTGNTSGTTTGTAGGSTGATGTGSTGTTGGSKGTGSKGTGSKGTGKAGKGSGGLIDI